MGLDILAYRQLQPVPDVGYLDGDFYRVEGGRLARVDGWGRYLYLHAAPGFKDRADGMGGAVYAMPDEEPYSFEAGDYGSYNVWRDDLARLAGYPQTASNVLCHPTYAAGAWKADGGPFWELIYMSDCEGTIGTATASKLLSDFDEWLPRAREFSSRHLDWITKYEHWHNAFRTASEGGAVVFC